MSKTISNEEFDKRLQEKLSQLKASELLHLAGVYEIVSEEYNNEIIEEWEAAQPEEEEVKLLKSMQYGFKTINILTDGSVYVVSGNCNDEKEVFYDENGDTYIRIDNEKVYIDFV